MIVRRLTLALVAAAGLATSAAVLVVALALALYAVLLAWLVPAGAAAVVAFFAAVVLGVGALIVGRAGRRRRAAEPVRGGGIVERAMAMVSERPVVAIAAALGAGFLAIRNPRYLGAAVRAFVEGRETPPSR